MRTIGEKPDLRKGKAFPGGRRGRPWKHALPGMIVLASIACFFSGCGDRGPVSRSLPTEPEDTVTVLYYSADESTWTERSPGFASRRGTSKLLSGDGPGARSWPVLLPRSR